MSDSATFSAYLLDGRGHAKTLDLQQISQWQPSDGLLWLHLNFSLDNDRLWLQQHANLDPIILAALLADDSRPRSTTIDDGLLMALRGVNLQPGAEPDDMVGIRLWVQKHRIISTHKRKLLSVDDIIDSLHLGQGPRSAADFLEQLLDRLVWRMSDTVDGFEERVADLETRVLEDSPQSMKSELACLRRQAITVRRYLSPQREALSKITSEKVDWLDANNRLWIREVADRLIRHIEDLDAVRERAAVTQEELLSQLSEQLNHRLYVLSVISAVFLPLGFLTGLLGINVGGIPGADFAGSFWIFIVLLVVLVLIQLWVFRRRHWI